MCRIIVFGTCGSAKPADVRLKIRSTCLRSQLRISATSHSPRNFGNFATLAAIRRASSCGRHALNYVVGIRRRQRPGPPRVVADGRTHPRSKSTAVRSRHPAELDLVVRAAACDTDVPQGRVTQGFQLVPGVHPALPFSHARPALPFSHARL
jgi:hypothetical protein